MKRFSVYLFLMIWVPFCAFAQSTSWEVKAVKKGKAYPVNVYLEDGTATPLVAIFEKGNDHFMDVKALVEGKRIAIKLIQSNDMLIPVKGISENGSILKVKAVDNDGNILDVKGVSRDGNTINIAAVVGEGDYIPLMAVSKDGVKRNIKGVKFMRENVEMEMSGVKVLAHLKAIPTIEVGDVDEDWGVGITADDGQFMNIVAINKKGREYTVSAAMAGKHPYLMHVRGESSYDIFIKFFNDEKGMYPAGVDEYGRMYELKAKAADGASYAVVGGEKMGNVIPMYVVGPGDKKYPVQATSSGGHVFDVKGIKAMKGDRDGSVMGVDGNVYYYAHVKALAPAGMEEN